MAALVLIAVPAVIWPIVLIPGDPTPAWRVITAAAIGTAVVVGLALVIPREVGWLLIVFGAVLLVPSRFSRFAHPTFESKVAPSSS